MKKQSYFPLIIATGILCMVVSACVNLTVSYPEDKQSARSNHALLKEMTATPSPTPTLLPTSATEATQFPSPKWVQLSSLCQNSVHGIIELRKELSVPDHFYDEEVTKTENDFDVNSYFTVLDHLSPESGIYIDYVYFWNQWAGWPVIYAQPHDQSPYTSYVDFVETLAGKSYSDEEYEAFYWFSVGLEYDPFEYLSHIQVDDTPDGFLQYTLLTMMGDQFYLYWHAHYHDRLVVCDRSELDLVWSGLSEYDIDIPTDLVYQAQSLNFEPKVLLDEETVTVRIVTFSKWEGFVETQYVFNRTFPHTILESETRNLLEYDCGIDF